MTNQTYENVLNFWFNEIEEKNWFLENSNLDKKITEKFLDLYEQAIRGELFQWRKTIEGRLAEILILDQFSRNMFRGSAKAFQFDSLALILSQEASILKGTKMLSPRLRAFIYMPFMHSESLIIHQEAVRLFQEPGLESSLNFELKHKEIIEKFNRYPHRNEILGRKSTVEEIEFLKSPGSSF
jgi:uncharacterized protein (DUF924 family)